MQQRAVGVERLEASDRDRAGARYGGSDRGRRTGHDLIHHQDGGVELRRRFVEVALVDVDRRGGVRPAVSNDSSCGRMPATIEDTMCRGHDVDRARDRGS